MKILAALKAFLKSILALCIRLRWPLLGAATLLLLAIGGAHFWNRYQYQQSAEYALVLLQKALATPQPSVLASSIDFKSLGEDLAYWILQERPHTPHTGDATAVARLSDSIQQALLKAVGDVRSNEKSKAPQASLLPMPDNIIAQIAATLSLQTVQQGVAILRAEVAHTQANHTFVLSLVLEHRAGAGWIVTRLANAQDIVRQFVAAEQARVRQREEALVERNRNAQRRMDGQVQVLSCTAHAKTLHTQNTALLTVAVVGYNSGALSVHNLNFFVELTGAGDAVQRHLNMAQRMHPGEHFTHTWNTDLNDTPEDTALLRAGALHCVARPHSMVLSSGEWLYIEEKTP